jgi:hypothetical protein
MTDAWSKNIRRESMRIIIVAYQCITQGSPGIDGNRAIFQIADGVLKDGLDRLLGIRVNEQIATQGAPQCFVAKLDGLWEESGWIA